MGVWTLLSTLYVMLSANTTRCIVQQVQPLNLGLPSLQNYESNKFLLLIFSSVKFFFNSRNQTKTMGKGNSG
jgi:hypothetical protein